jgi:hypothetical protein
MNWTKYVIGIIGVLIWGQQAYGSIMIAHRHWNKHWIDVILALGLLLPLQLMFVFVSVYIMLPPKEKINDDYTFIADEE